MYIMFLYDETVKDNILLKSQSLSEFSEQSSNISHEWMSDESTGCRSISLPFN